MKRFKGTGHKFFIGALLTLIVTSIALTILPTPKVEAALGDGVAATYGLTVQGDSVQASASNFSFKWLDAGHIEIIINGKTDLVLIAIPENDTGNGASRLIDQRKDDTAMDYFVEGWPCPASWVKAGETFDNEVNSLTLDIDFLANVGGGCISTSTNVINITPNDAKYSRSYFKWIDAGAIEAVDELTVENDTMPSRFENIDPTRPLVFIAVDDGDTECKDTIVVSPDFLTARHFLLATGGSRYNASFNDDAPAEAQAPGCKWIQNGNKDNTTNIDTVPPTGNKDFWLAYPQDHDKDAGTGESTLDPGANGAIGGLELNCSWSINPLTWLMCPLVEGASKVATLLDKEINEQLSIQVEGSGSTLDQTTPAGIGTYGAWAAMRNIALSMLVLIALAMVISQSISVGPFDAYTVKKVLPRIVIAVIFITLSWQLTKLLVQFTNDLGQGIGRIISEPFDKSLKNPDVSGTGVTLGSFGLAFAFLSGLDILVVLSLALTGMLAVLTAFLVITFRNILLILLIITAPVAIILWILPNTKKAWNFWQTNFTAVLLAFPIIIAIITTGRVFAAITSNTPGAADSFFLQIVIFIAYFGPYFAIPAAFRLAGGAVASIGGAVNDRSRGIFDRNKKFRQGQTAKNVEGMKTGNRFNGAMFGKNRFTNKVNTGLQYASNAQRAGVVPWKMRRNMETALGDKNFDTAKEFLEKNDAARAIKNDDDLLWGAMKGTDEKSVREEIRQRAPGRFSDPRVLDDAVARVMRFKREAGSEVGMIAATLAQAGTGTGFNYRDDGIDDDMTDAIIRASGDNRALSGRMLADMKGAAVQSGRYEFGGGFAKSAQVMDQRRTALGHTQYSKAGQAVAERYDSAGRVRYKGNTYDADNNLTSAYTTNGGVDYEDMDTPDVRNKLMNDAYDSNAGAVIAGKLQTVKNFVPVANQRLDTAMAGDSTGALRELANVAGKFDAAAQVAPQNAKAWGDGVMARQLQVGKMNPEMREKLAPLINQRTPQVDASGNVVKDAADNIMYSESSRPSLTVHEITEYLRGDQVFQQTRREYGSSALTAAQNEQMRQNGPNQLPNGQLPGSLGGRI